MKIIGLTGGIASGKSTVAALLRARSIDVIDADELARDAVRPGSDGLAAVIARFGEQMLAADGSLDRKKLGAVVFTDEKARKDLNAIVHPRVAMLAQERLAALRDKGAPVAVYEVPLLFENNLERAVDASVLVAAPVDVQLARLQARDGIDEAAARARIAAQMSLDDKRARATKVIENAGSMNDTARQLRAIWRELTGDDVAFG